MIKQATEWDKEENGRRKKGWAANSINLSN
jgi:hypothetical protein